MESTNTPKILRQQIVSLVRNLSILDKSGAACCGITLAQCHALVEVGRAGEIYLNKLAEILKLDKSTMSRNVDNLVKAGYLIRDIDQENRRFIKIKLSENGEKLFKETEENMEQYYSKIFESIPKDKREQVKESLNILLAAIQDDHYH